MKNFHHPDISFMTSQQGWLSEQSFCEIKPKLKLLTSNSLLTDQLKEVSITGIAVKRITQEFLPDNSIQRRDVVIYTDNEAEVIASTLIPAQVIKDYPRLVSLGNNPIGEHLEQNYNARREHYEFMAIEPDSSLKNNFNSTGEAWFRRYRYKLPENNITIVELLSSNILKRLAELGNQNI